jgi:dihydroneopterin aldolase
MASDDRIELRGLRVAGIVGVLPHEQAQAQPLELDLDVSVDLAEAGASDDLADTVDYGALCELAEQVVTATNFALLEALAERVADAVLAAAPAVTSVTVAVRKLRPPVAQQLATSGVRITRHQA